MRATTFIRQLGEDALSEPGYGLLYNWYAASDANFAPAGWSVPTTYQLIDLIVIYLGGDTNAGYILKEVGTVHWNPPNPSIDTYGFSFLGAGVRNNSGIFQNFKTYGRLNTITENDINTAQNWLATSSEYSFIQSSVNKKYGASVRLIKNDSTDPGTMTDYDGNIYPTVKIGTQVWTAANWKCTHLKNGTVIPEVTDNTAWAALTTKGCCTYV